MGAEAATSAVEWGETPWSVTWRPRPATPPGRADVAVIGGGLTGLAAALELARAGCAVALLEARGLGSGASGRTGGMVLEDTAVGAVPGLGGVVESLCALLDRESIACDLSLPGCAELAHVSLRGDDPASGWRDGETRLVAREVVPGGTLDPGALVADLARAADRAGASLFEATPVRAIEREPEGLRLVCDRGVLRAPRAIVALNAYTEALVTGSEPVKPALTLAVATAPLYGRAREALAPTGGRPFYTVDLPYLWGRAWGDDGRLVFGGGLAPSSDDATVLPLFERLESRIRALHPSLTGVAFTHRWGGPVAFTPSRRPLLEAVPGLPGVVVAGAYAGHGVALSCLCGTRAAREALAQRT